MPNPITSPEEQYPAFKDRIVAARKAGYSDTEISLEMQGRVKQAVKAGYSPEEINKELGEIKGPSLTEGFIKPVAKELSTTAARVAPAVAGGLVGGIPGGMAGAAGGELLAQSLEQLYEGGKLDIAKYKPEQALLSTVMGAIPGVEDIPGLPKITSQVGRLALRGGEAGTFGAAYDVASRAMQGEPITLKGAGQAFLSTAPFGVAMGGLLEPPSTIKPAKLEPHLVQATEGIKPDLVKEAPKTLDANVPVVQDSPTSVQLDPKVQARINNSEMLKLQQKLDELVNKSGDIKKAMGNKAFSKVPPDVRDHLEKLDQINQADQIKTKKQLTDLMTKQNALDAAALQQSKQEAIVTEASKPQVIDSTMGEVLPNIQTNHEDTTPAKTAITTANNIAQQSQAFKINPDDKINIGNISGKVVSSNSHITRIQDSKGNTFAVSTRDLRARMAIDATSIPEIGEDGRIHNGPIPTSVEPNNTYEQAEARMDGERIVNRDINETEQGIQDVINNNRPGLSRPFLSDDIAAALGGIGFRGEEGQMGPNRESYGSTNILTTVAPSYQVGLNFQNDYNIPTFTQVIYPGMRAARDSAHAQAIVRKVGESIFGDYYYSNSRKTKAAMERIEGLLENIKRTNGDVTFKVDGQERSGTFQEAIAALNANPKEFEVATKLRRFYDDAVRMGWISPDDHIAYYSHRSPIRTVEDLTRFRLDPRVDEYARQQHHRTGNLLPRVTDARMIFALYNNGMIQSKILFPFEQSANQVVNLIKDSATQRYFSNYIKDVRNIPKHEYVQANARIMKTLDNWIGWVDQMRGTNYNEQLQEWMGRNNISKNMVRSTANMLYKTYLGYRPVSSFKNFMNKYTALPLLDNMGLTKGMLYGRTKEGKIALQLAGIQGPSDELLNRVTELLRPMRRFTLEEDRNRNWIYLSKYKSVLNAYDKYANNWDKFKNEISLDYYHKIVQDRVHDLFDQNRIGKNQEIGIANNGAHFLADVTTFISQVPVERGGKPEIFRASPTKEVSGIFLNWNMMTGNYMYQLTKTWAKNPIKNAGLGLRIAKMAAFYAAVDTLYETAANYPLQSNPFSSRGVAQGLTGVAMTTPIPSMARDAANLAVNKVIGQWIEGRNDEYTKMEANKAWKDLQRQALPIGITMVTGGRVPGQAVINLYKKLQGE